MSYCIASSPEINFNEKRKLTSSNEAFEHYVNNGNDLRIIKDEVFPDAIKSDGLGTKLSLVAASSCMMPAGPVSCVLVRYRIAHAMMIMELLSRIARSGGRAHTETCGSVFCFDCSCPNNRAIYNLID